MKHRFVLSKAWLGGVLAAGLIALALWIRLGPIPPITPDTTPTIVDRNGIVLYEPLSSTGTRNEWLNDVPPAIANATIASEDRRFEQHLGIDPIAIARAVVHDVVRLRAAEGGSTITQQVAKMLLGNPPRTIAAKVREAIVALRIEHRYTKSQILALYVNLAPYGEQTIGIARASHRYFACAPDELTIAQSAWLASLPQRPSTPRRALARQRVVLARMKTLRLIDANEYRDARAERLSLDRGLQPTLAPHFVERVRASLGQNAPRRIETTLDANLQASVRGIIAAERGELLRHGAHSVAVAVLDNRTGEWLAWEGSGDYFGTSFGGAIDGVTTLRQPGSTLKPFTYALAFEQGFTPATVLADVPSHFPTAEEGVAYTPRNYDGGYRGPLRARLALAGSENVPAVALLSKVGSPALLRLLRGAGFHDLTRTADYYGLGLTLGDAEVTLEQLVTAYATFARGGVSVSPSMIRAAAPLSTDKSVCATCGSAEDKHLGGPSGSSLSTNRSRSATGRCGTDTLVCAPAEAAAPATRTVSQRTAFWITDILSDPKAREFIFGRGGNLEFPFPVAVKTGTSQAYHDNWTIGYTRAVTVGVWVGNFDRTALRNSSGVTGAGPIFHAVMLAAMRRAGGNEQTTIVDRPDDLEEQPICALSGHRPSTSCPATETEWLPRDADVEFCDWHHASGVSWPSEYREWAAARERHPTGNAPRANVAREAIFRITSPPNDATYLVDPTLHREFQALHLRATHDATWIVDGKPAAREWPLRTGQHTIVATNARGERDRVSITVR
ncbi:MAG TPA: transglycosylase domain-containing protein [Thermoanaerobaculia bacterium]|nr:transglycosylase domain-containing protein [Thermoanaerobaculia bacterium]